MPESRVRLPFAWHLARWRFTSPGPRGLVILALFGLALVLPSHRLGLGETWSEAHRSVLLLGTLAATFLIARDAAASDELEFWLQHKGISPADWAFARWRANLLPLFGTVALFTGLLFAAAPLYGLQPSLASSVALLGTLGVTAAVLSVLLFGLGATGSPHAPELAMLLVVVTLFAPLLRAAWPAPMALLLTYALPPLVVVAELRDALDARAWRTAARLALHVAAWSTAVMLLGVQLLQRRGPKP